VDGVAPGRSAGGGVGGVGVLGDGPVGAGTEGSLKVGYGGTPDWPGFGYVGYGG
jgi:hypothetical protein